jgi:hypothetical protein
MNRNETHYLENCISQKHQRWLLSEISDVQTKNTGQIAIPNQPISEYKINKLNPAVTWLEKVLITNNVGAIAPDFNEKSNIKLETGSCYFPQVGTMSRTDADLYGIVPLSKEITIHLTVLYLNALNTWSCWQKKTLQNILLIFHCLLIPNKINRY